MPFHLPKSLGKSRQGSPARTRNSTASRNSRLSFAVTPLSDALPGSNDAIFSQAASLTTNRSRSTNAQTPPKRGLNRNYHQRGSPECQQALNHLGQGRPEQFHLGEGAVEGTAPTLTI